MEKFTINHTLAWLEKCIELAKKEKQRYMIFDIKDFEILALQIRAQQSVHPTRRSVAQKGKSKSKGSAKPARG